MMQSFGIAAALQSSEGGFVVNPGVGFILMTMLTLTTGTAFIMWLGEQITERGIGNGMSLIIFAGIVVGLPSAVTEIYTNAFVTGQWPILQVLLIVVMMIAVVGVHRFGGARRAPHPSAVRQARSRAQMMGGQQTHLPLKVNAGGVIPVIFASSLLAFPQTLRQIAFVRDSLAERNAGLHQSRTAALLHDLHPRHHLLLLLLRLDHLQPERGGRQHAEVRRLCAWYPAGPEHRRVHEQDSYPNHHGGWPLPGVALDCCRKS